MQEDDGKKPKKKSPLIEIIIALLLEACCPVVGFFGLRADHVGWIFLIAAFLMPVAGSVIGFVSAFNENRTKLSFALSIIAAVLPAAALILTIILMSAGVIIIALM